MEAIDVFRRVVYFNGDILLVAFLLCAILILILSTFLYYLAPKDVTLEEDFSSIPATMYLSVMMLTGQGGPAGWLPWYTKLICAITAVFAVAQFAIPASMLTWGFEQEAERRIKKRHEQRAKKLAMIKSGHMQDQELSSESSDGNEDDFTEEWKEYEDVVVGSESDTDEDKEKGKKSKASGQMLESTLSAKEYARVLKIFSALDVNETGGINTEDFLKVHALSGESMLEQLDPNGDGVTEAHEFVDWLCKVKSSYDVSVFEMLLNDLENVGKTRKHAAHPVPLGGGGGVPDQLIQFAEEFRALQKQVTNLQLELRLKNEEIEKLKSQS
jgi:hypothetical protein